MKYSQENGTLIRTYEPSDIRINDGWISVEGIGRVGLWWYKYDHKVTLSYGFGESFIADTYDEVKNGILTILNSKHTKPF